MIISGDCPQTYSMDRKHVVISDSTMLEAFYMLAFHDQLKYFLFTQESEDLDLYAVTLFQMFVRCF